jgi:hypothetical protein
MDLKAMDKALTLETMASMLLLVFERMVLHGKKLNKMAGSRARTSLKLMKLSQRVPSS